MCQVLSFTNFKARGEKVDDRIHYHCFNPNCEAVAYHGEPVSCVECGSNLMMEVFIDGGAFEEKVVVVK